MLGNRVPTPAGMRPLSRISASATATSPPARRRSSSGGGVAAPTVAGSPGRALSHAANKGGGTEAATSGGGGGGASSSGGGGGGGASGVGGLGGGDIDRGAIVTLKSDVTLIQAEIDARTGLGGIIDLQHKLQTLNWSPDPVTTIHVAFALQALLLSKVNELTRVCGVGEGAENDSSVDQLYHRHPTAARPPVRTPSSTLSRRSRVGDIVNFFHNIDRRVEVTSAAACSSSISYPSRPQPPPLVNTGALGSAAQLSEGTKAPRAAPDPTPRGAAAASPDGRSHSAKNVEYDEATHGEENIGDTKSGDFASDAESENDVCWTAAASAPAAGGGCGAGARRSGSPQSDIRNASTGTSNGGGGGRGTAEADSTMNSVVGQQAAVNAALEQSLLFLQKKLAVFTYMERYLFELDAADSAIKAAMHPAIAALGLDLTALAGRVDGGLGKRVTSLAHSASTATNAANAHSRSCGDGGSSPPAAGSPTVGGGKSIKFDTTQSSLLLSSSTGGGGGGGGAGPDDLESAVNSKALAEQRQARVVIAFQSALLAAIADELEQQKQAHHAELRQHDQRLHALEDALRQQQETFERERQFHIMRQERASNLLLMERSRGTTPNCGESRPLSRISLKPGTPEVGGGSMGAGWAGENSSVLLPASATTSQPAIGQQQQQLPHWSKRGQVVLTPLRRADSVLPLVATRTRDIPGEAQREYLRVIADQSEIIKDLSRRAASSAT